MVTKKLEFTILQIFRGNGKIQLDLPFGELTRNPLLIFWHYLFDIIIFWLWIWSSHALVPAFYNWQHCLFYRRLFNYFWFRLISAIISVQLTHQYPRIPWKLNLNAVQSVPTLSHGSLRSAFLWKLVWSIASWPQL